MLTRPYFYSSNNYVPLGSKKMPNKHEIQGRIWERYPLTTKYLFIVSKSSPVFYDEGAYSNAIYSTEMKVNCE